MADFGEIKFELVDPEDPQSEKEENKGEEDADEKVRSERLDAHLIAINKLINSFLAFNVPSYHHPEIQTPPPKWMACIS